jgi:hypothetical protein
MKKITAVMAIEALREVVKLRGGDFVYETPSDTKSCRYAFDGEPSCAVGMAINIIDPTAFRVVEKFERTEGAFIAAALRDVIPITVDARNVFGAAQAMQDTGRLYSAMLYEAEATFARLS